MTAPKTFAFRVVDYKGQHVGVYPAYALAEQARKNCILQNSAAIYACQENGTETLVAGGDTIFDGDAENTDNF